jgi:hypothetical protein
MRFIVLRRKRRGKRSMLHSPKHSLLLFYMRFATVQFAESMHRVEANNARAKA